MRIAHFGWLLSLALLVACSNDSSTSQDSGIDALVGNDGQPPADTKQADTLAPDVGVDAAVPDSSGPGKATTVTLHLHDNEVTVFLSTMTVGGKEATGWDLYMAHDNGPNTYLGEGVTAINLGADKGFHEVDEAPEEGYQPDGDALDALIIGTSWRSGGEGSTGFIMSNNVYLLKLADDTYAKIQVLSAKAGEIPILCYRQADGSRNLQTEE